MLIGDVLRELDELGQVLNRRQQARNPLIACGELADVQILPTRSETGDFKHICGPLASALASATTSYSAVGLLSDG